MDKRCWKCQFEQQKTCEHELTIFEKMELEDE